MTAPFRTSKKRGRKPHGPRFVQLHWYLLDSEAWKALSFGARAAFVEVARLYNGHNNGQLALSARTLAERLGCSKATAARALNELEEKGFVGVQRLGTFRRRDRLATEYFLTLYRNDVNYDPPTKAFMRWHRHGLKSAKHGLASETEERKSPSTVSSMKPSQPFEPKFRSH
jgi:DNA-binding MarR family transcriptional regulator